MSKKSEYQDVREAGFIFEEKVSLTGTVNGVDGVNFANMPFRVDEMLEIMKQFNVTSAIVRSRAGNKVGKLSIGVETIALGAESLEE